MIHPSHSVYYMEKGYMQSLVGLSVRLFKGNTLAHLACKLQRKYFQLKVLNCLVIYFVVVNCA